MYTLVRMVSPLDTLGGDITAYGCQ
jgi:hypothetical protein